MEVRLAIIEDLPQIKGMYKEIIKLGAYPFLRLLKIIMLRLYILTDWV